MAGLDTDTLFEHTYRVKQAFEGVQAAFLLLAHHILIDLKDLPIWAETVDQEGFESSRGRVIESIRRQEIDFDKSAAETYSFAGAIAATDKTLQLIQSINTAKDLLKAKVTEYRKSKSFHPSMPASKLLANAGYPGIKIRQATRHLKMINYHPRRIAWSKAKGSSNKIITQEEALEMLNAVGSGAHISYQMDLLKKLDSKEKLVVQRQIKPYPAANITTFKNCGVCSKEKIESSLPVFFKYDPEKPNPVVEYTNKQPRSQRADKKLEDEPYITSISAYRYKKKARRNA